MKTFNQFIAEVTEIKFSKKFGSGVGSGDYSIGASYGGLGVSVGRETTSGKGDRVEQGVTKALKNLGTPASTSSPFKTSTEPSLDLGRAQIKKKYVDTVLGTGRRFNKMKTFKEFQEGLFDWLPRGNWGKIDTRYDTVNKAQKKNPKFVRGHWPGKPHLMDPNPTRYNMPQPEQQFEPTPKPSAKNFFKFKGALEV